MSQYRSSLLRSTAVSDRTPGKHSRNRVVRCFGKIRQLEAKCRHFFKTPNYSLIDLAVISHFVFLFFFCCFLLLIKYSIRTKSLQSQNTKSKVTQKVANRKKIVLVQIKELGPTLHLNCSQVRVLSGNLVSSVYLQSVLPSQNLRLGSS